MHLQQKRNHRFNLILKARQHGITTLYCIDELDEALWVSGMTCGIIAHEAKKLPDYFNIVKRAFTNLPEELKPQTQTDTKYMYEFTHRFDGEPLDSSIYVSTDIRGGTVQDLHITESAYIKDRSKLASGSKQAVPKNGRISEETTGNGFNEFYDEYIEAYNNPSPGEYDYKAYFYPWFINEEYSIDGELENITEYEKWLREFAKEKYSQDLTDGQLLWRRWKIKQLKAQSGVAGLSGEQLFKQEYPANVQEAFQSGAGNVFDAEKIDSITPADPIDYESGVQQINAMTVTAEQKDDLLGRFKRLDYREFKIWNLPEAGVNYFVGVDPSDGEGSDFGAISVWSEDYRKVAEYYGKLRPDELSEFAVDACEFYNHAYLGIENNMLTTILFASKIYDNYYFEVRIDEKTLKKTKKLGWNTNSKTRDVMIDDFLILFDEGNLTINSLRTFSEMRTFVKKDNGKREHADGKWDDMLFGDFIAVQMIKRRPKVARAFTQKPIGL